MLRFCHRSYTPEHYRANLCSSAARIPRPDRLGSQMATLQMQMRSEPLGSKEYPSWTHGFDTLGKQAQHMGGVSVQGRYSVTTRSPQRSCVVE